MKSTFSLDGVAYMKTNPNVHTKYCVIEITMDVGIEGWLLMITRLIKKVNCKSQGVGNTIIIL